MEYKNTSQCWFGDFVILYIDTLMRRWKGVINIWVWFSKFFCKLELEIEQPFGNHPCFFFHPYHITFTFYNCCMWLRSLCVWLFCLFGLFCFLWKINEIKLSLSPTAFLSVALFFCFFFTAVLGHCQLCHFFLLYCETEMSLFTAKGCLWCCWFCYRSTPRTWRWAAFFAPHLPHRNLPARRCQAKAP